MENLPQQHDAGKGQNTSFEAQNELSIKIAKCTALEKGLAALYRDGIGVNCEELSKKYLELLMSL